MNIRRVQPVSGVSTNLRTRSNLEQGIIKPVEKIETGVNKKPQEAFEVIFSKKVMEEQKTNAKVLKR
jgi:hypothetical protein